MCVDENRDLWKHWCRFYSAVDIKNNSRTPCVPMFITHIMRFSEYMARVPRVLTSSRMMHKCSFLWNVSWIQSNLPVRPPPQATTYFKRPLSNFPSQLESLQSEPLVSDHLPYATTSRKRPRPLLGLMVSNFLLFLTSDMRPLHAIPSHYGRKMGNETPYNPYMTIKFCSYIRTSDFCQSLLVHHHTVSIDTWKLHRNALKSLWITDQPRSQGLSSSRPLGNEVDYRFVLEHGILDLQMDQASETITGYQSKFRPLVVWLS